MKILAIIVARKGSKGIPNKNTKLLKDKPLIGYTFQEVKKVKSIDRVILSTDDNKAIELAHNYNIEVPFVRPEYLSNDKSDTKDVIRHALEFLWQKEKYNPDTVLLLQPTSPLRKYTHIQESIELYKSNKKYKSLVSVVKIKHHFNPEMIMRKHSEVIFESINNSNESKITNRNQKPIYYARNGAAIYLFDNKWFLESNKIYDKQTIGYEMNFIDSLDIDDMEDWILAEKLIE